MRSHRARIALASLLAGAALAGLGSAPGASAATITPTVTTDDITQNNGNCTLREAVLAADANAAVDRCAAGSATSPDVIVLLAPLYQLTIPGAGDDSDLSGDLDVFLSPTSPLTIESKSATGESVIDGTSGANSDRVIDQPASLATGSLTLVQVTLDDGHPPTGSGGALRMVSSRSVTTLDGSRVTNSSSQSSGGGILAAGDLTLKNSTVSGNSSTAPTGLVGGGIRGFGSLTANRSTISGNSVVSPDDASADDIFGGGIAATGGPVSVADSTIASNTVTALDSSDAAHGGGIYAENAPLRIERSTLDNNTVSAAGSLSSGGGIDYTDLGTIDGTLVLQNSTLADNHAQTDAAALQVRGGSTAIRSSTFTLNAATAGRSIFYDTASVAGTSLAVGATILSENGANECSTNGSIDSLGFNIDRGTSCGLTGAGDLQNTDPGLLGEADNGGPTVTHALAPGSPALDRIPAASCDGVDGTPLATDQRGAPRGFDEDGDSIPECDVGAYELNRCQGQIVDVVGAGAIGGTAAPDVILGSNGPDSIDPKQGDDRVCAGGGDDTVIERPNGGSDALDGGGGSDTLLLGLASPLSPAGTVDLPASSASGIGMSAALSSIENATGSPAGDTLIGDGGPNVLDGLSGDDTITGGAGPDTLLGGNDDDRLFARDGFGDTLDCGAGTADTAQTDRLSLDAVTSCEGVDALAEPSLLPPPAAATPSAGQAANTTKAKCKKKKKKKHKRSAGAAKKKKCKKKKRRKKR